MIAQNTDPKSKHQNSKRYQPVSPNPFAKFSPAEKMLPSVLVHVRGLLVS